MAWPNPNEYAEAIQNPKQAFSNSELQNALVVTNNMGLPRPISGNFATVFEVKSGTKKWAIRCFMREVTNQQERYTAISKHLQKHNLACMVGFEYLPQGIRVKGHWYPILKMDWTEGSRLDIFLEKNLHNPQKLYSLALQWNEICRQLQQANIAHGDLQHGNILVTAQEEIKLIDYDGVFIADTLGLTSNEIGHRHYQHPSRTSDKNISFSNYKNIDNFSSCIIFLSLLALSIDGFLWQSTQAGEENLLFRDTDYRDPKKSTTIELLQRHSDKRIRDIAQYIQQISAAYSYLDVPTIDKLGLNKNTDRNWLKDHLSNTKLFRNFVDTHRSTTPSWLQDHIKPEASLLDFTDEFVLAEKGAIETAFQASPMRWFKLIFRVFASNHIANHFAKYPIASDKVQLQTALSEREKQTSQLRKQLRNLISRKDEVTNRFNSEIRQVDLEIKKLTDALNNTYQQEKDEIAKLDQPQIEQYYQSRLANYPIAPNKIPGIGPARISALNYVDIDTAADIIPANANKGRSALSRVKGSYPSSEWRDLEQWREKLKQRIPKPFIQGSNSIAAKKISDIYDSRRRELKSKLEEKNQLVNKLRINSSNAQQINTLSQEINETQALLDEIELRIRNIQVELKRYEKITPANLLARILKS